MPDMTPADDARAMTEAERTKLHAHMWVTFVESPATKAADGRPITVPYILARWIANLPTVHDLRIAREELDTPEMRATLTAFASATRAATTEAERAEIVKELYDWCDHAGDARTQSVDVSLLRRAAFVIASATPAETVELEPSPDMSRLPESTGCQAVKPDGGPPTPDATAALLAEADDFIAEQGDSYFARSFARFAAALRAEHEKAKELDRSNAAVVRQHGELQDEIVRLRERLTTFAADAKRWRWINERLFLIHDPADSLGPSQSTLCLSPQKPIDTPRPLSPASLVDVCIAALALAPATPTARVTGGEDDTR